MGERKFFLQQISENRQTIYTLMTEIDKFGQLMAEEKANTNDLIIRTHVSKICRQALNKFEQDSTDLQYRYNQKSQSSITSNH